MEFDSQTSKRQKKVGKGDCLSFDTMDKVKGFKGFVGDDAYISMAPLSKDWKEAWGSSPKTTRAVDRNTTPEKFTLYLDSLSKRGVSFNLAAVASAGIGRLDLLQMMDWCPPGTHKDALSSSGHLQYLKGVEEDIDSPGVFSVAAAASAAAKYGHLDILKWIDETWDTTGTTTTSDNEYIRQQFYVDICLSAASAGQLEVFKWAQRDSDYLGDVDYGELSYEYDHSTAFAIQGGHLDMLKYAVGNGCSLIHDAYVDAAEYGHLDILEWLVENGEKHGAEEWDPVHYSFGFPVKTCLCHKAALGGHLDVLEWAVRSGCVLFQETVVVLRDMVNGDNLEAVTWLVENGVEDDF